MRGQFSQRLLRILTTEGMAGLMKRTWNRFKRKPMLVTLYVLESHLKDLVNAPPALVDLEVKQITTLDDDDIESLVKFDFYVHSKAEVLQHLAEEGRCYVAKHKGRVVSCYWTVSKEFYDYYLGRRFELADDEGYNLGAFTLAEFRGKNILPWLVAESWRKQSQNHPDWRVLGFVRVNNKASLRACQKLGFTIVGRVGFIELLFGIRFQYLLGRNALRKTTRRNFLQII